VIAGLEEGDQGRDLRIVSTTSSYTNFCHNSSNYSVMYLHHARSASLLLTVLRSYF